MLKELKIGTRGSPLALIQANGVRDQLLQAHPGLNVMLVKIKTTGDKVQDVPLAKIGGKGLFVKEIEEALLKGKIDLAVHSVKDIPTEFPKGLGLSAVTRREDPRDVLITREGIKFKDLPPGAKIGTSSLRRQAQLLHFRSDLNPISLRGNLETRLKKLEAGSFDGIILALAGIKRLGFEERITEILPEDIFLPAIGQGALGIETRRDDRDVEACVRLLNDRDSWIAVSTERAFLKKLEGGCQIPIAAFARIQGETLHMDGMVGTVDGKRIVRGSLDGPVEEAETLGIKLAEILLNQGAKEILDEVYRQSGPAVSIET